MAVCFILSGTLKVLSLRAFAGEVQLYGDAYIGERLHEYSMVIAVAVCVVEVALGAMALWSRLALPTGILFAVMLLFFVYITGMNLFYPGIMGSIETCGCFGEMVHFTPVTSFLKSVILMLLASVNLFYVAKAGVGSEKGVI